ncbi:MAG: hypothetical protein EHM14_15940 [Methanothrix sp.]|nr:MAG: hypothetical protein EHM14_15940 [Methanothrix sp.]
MIDMGFVMAGHAIFTVGNDKGNHYTFRVSCPKNNPDLHFIGLLTGPDNGADYTYMGILLPDGAVRLTKASKYTGDSTPVRVASWACKVILGKAALPAGYSIQHAGRCGRCGRLLTTPESIERGIGPECWDIMHGGAAVEAPKVEELIGF